MSLSGRECLVSPARPGTVAEVAASCKVTASVTSGCVSHRSHYQCRTMGVLLKWLVSVCPFHDLKHTHIDKERISVRCYVASLTGCPFPILEELTVNGKKVI